MEKWIFEYSLVFSDLLFEQFKVKLLRVKINWNLKKEQKLELKLDGKNEPSFSVTDNDFFQSFSCFGISNTFFKASDSSVFVSGQHVFANIFGFAFFSLLFQQTAAIWVLCASISRRKLKLIVRKHCAIARKNLLVHFCWFVVLA